MHRLEVDFHLLERVMLWDRLSLACQKCKHFICLELYSCAELTRPLRHMKAELCKGMTVLIILDLGTEISFVFFCTTQELFQFTDL